ncbi:hypothetical protein B0H17DRAFT_1200677 [Mycena rosella]|uniref:Uncharacterized protein n=1 Tax=Mycena rosella TaxID=1033263 RepID=A0AAD7DIL8_MYCRO|nr:hypothetical protein B0H17DRAFT_1200677 [Mycena rosella]
MAGALWSVLSIYIGYFYNDITVLLINPDAVFNHAFRFEELDLRLPFLTIDRLRDKNMPMLRTLDIGPSYKCPDGRIPSRSAMVANHDPSQHLGSRPLPPVDMPIITHLHLQEFVLAAVSTPIPMEMWDIDTLWLPGLSF